MRNSLRVHIWHKMFWLHNWFYHVRRHEPHMSLNYAMRLLVDNYTSSDERTGITLYAGGRRYGYGYGMGDEIQAWRVVRRYLHMPSMTRTSELLDLADNKINKRNLT